MTIGSRLYVSAALLLLFLFGACESYSAIEDSIHGEKTRAWTSVPCQIISSRVGVPKDFSSGSLRFPFEISYEYKVDGVKYRSTIPWWNYTASSDYYEAGKLLERYPARSDTTCLVDPSNPANSVLTTPNTKISAAIFSGFFLISLFLAVVGLVGLILTWFKWRSDGRGLVIRFPNLISGAFGSFFFVAGVGLFLTDVLPTLYRGLQAREWPQVACVIDHSGIQTHEGHGSNSTTTFSVGVIFEYNFAGHPYKSSRYDIGRVSTNNFDTYQNIVNSLPPGGSVRF